MHEIKPNNHNNSGQKAKANAIHCFWRCYIEPSKNGDLLPRNEAHENTFTHFKLYKHAKRCYEHNYR